MNLNQQATVTGAVLPGTRVMPKAVLSADRSVHRLLVDRVVQHRLMLAQLWSELPRNDS